MTTTRTVYILLLSGDSEDARRLVQSRYPECTQALLSKRELRENGWKGQVRAFRQLRGEALVIFSEALSALKEPRLLRCSAFLHNCRETVFAYSSGEVRIYSRLALFGQLPEVLFSAALDFLVLIGSWMFAHVLCLFAKPQPHVTADAELDVAYLYPYPFDRAAPGGAMTHVTGFLSGLAENTTCCEIFSGCRMTVDQFPLHQIPNKRKLYIVSESQALSYNIRFALAVKKKLKGRRARFFYQRHGRFVTAGALLSWLLSVPLVLEYNGSEFWITQHWDPARFRRILLLCEEVSISTAFLIVVVSDALRDELLQRGVLPERILVNPNAVDPAVFQPGCGGPEARGELGFTPDDVVVSFVGSFSYWHGIPVLQQAILRLMERSKGSAGLSKLRFLLVGDGLLQAEVRQALREYEQSRVVVFTGLLPHDSIPRLLDASDILVSPHVPMPDGSPFFGSPTKLFEYMAMGKAIVASNLDQLSQVLDHGTTAWLVPPGNEVELAAAIEMLANDPELRRCLGQNARATILDRHTWRVNAARVLAHFSGLRQSNLIHVC
jgi:glycosyltransferase involved in cell wall biosynthesis